MKKIKMFFEMLIIAIVVMVAKTATAQDGPLAAYGIPNSNITIYGNGFLEKGPHTQEDMLSITFNYDALHTKAELAALGYYNKWKVTNADGSTTNLVITAENIPWFIKESTISYTYLPSIWTTRVETDGVTLTSYQRSLRKGEGYLVFDPNSIPGIVNEGNLQPVAWMSTECGNPFIVISGAVADDGPPLPTREVEKVIYKTEYVIVPGANTTYEYVYYTPETYDVFSVGVALSYGGQYNCVSHTPVYCCNQQNAGSYFNNQTVVNINNYSYSYNSTTTNTTNNSTVIINPPHPPVIGLPTGIGVDGTSGDVIPPLPPITGTGINGGSGGSGTGGGGGNGGGDDTGGPNDGTGKHANQQILAQTDKNKLSTPRNNGPSGDNGVLYHIKPSTDGSGGSKADVFEPITTMTPKGTGQLTANSAYSNSTTTPRNISTGNGGNLNTANLFTGNTTPRSNVDHAPSGASPKQISINSAYNAPKPRTDSYQTTTGSVKDQVSYQNQQNDSPRPHQTQQSYTTSPKQNAIAFNGGGYARPAAISNPSNVSTGRSGRRR